MCFGKVLKSKVTKGELIIFNHLEMMEGYLPGAARGAPSHWLGLSFFRITIEPHFLCSQKLYQFSFNQGNERRCSILRKNLSLVKTIYLFLDVIANFFRNILTFLDLLCFDDGFVNSLVMGLTLLFACLFVTTRVVT